MDWLTNFADDRLLTNMIGLHIVLGALLIASVVMRRIIMHGGNHVVRWTGFHWLDGFSKEAVRASPVATLLVHTWRNGVHRNQCDHLPRGRTRHAGGLSKLVQPAHGS